MIYKNKFYVSDETVSFLSISQKGGSAFAIVIVNAIALCKWNFVRYRMESPQEFPFPFPAYKIQEQFMKELYGCLENGKLGLFESPTGTGKSLSIICGALKWLVDHEKWRKQELTSAIAQMDDKLKNYEESSDDWFTVQTEKMKLNSEKQPLEAKLNALVEYEGEREKLKKIVESKKAAKTKVIGKMKQQPAKKSDKSEEIDSDVCDIEKDLLLEDALSNSESSDEEDEKEPLFKNTKIFFCSRTHSQLTQFVHELKRSPYSQDISVVPISSRYLCNCLTHFYIFSYLSIINLLFFFLGKITASTKM